MIYDVLLLISFKIIELIFIGTLLFSIYLFIKKDATFFNIKLKLSKIFQLLFMSTLLYLSLYGIVMSNLPYKNKAITTIILALSLFTLLTYTLKKASNRNS